MSTQTDRDGSTQATIFMSYSRSDAKFVDQIIAALQAIGYDVLLDRKNIPGGDDWKSRIGALIQRSDTLVFCLSPDFLASEICLWEVAEARRLGKRVLPIACRTTGNVELPTEIAAMNVVYFYEHPKIPGSGFGTGFSQLTTALASDLGWLQEHTRLLDRALDWDRGGRMGARTIAGREDLVLAKAWLGKRPLSMPKPPEIIADFLHASEAFQMVQARTAAAAEWKTRWLYRSIFAVTLFGLVGSLTMWWQAEDARRVAERAKVEAEAQKEQVILTFIGGRAHAARLMADVLSFQGRPDCSAIPRPLHDFMTSKIMDVPFRTGRLSMHQAIHEAWITFATADKNEEGYFNRRVSGSETREAKLEALGISTLVGIRLICYLVSNGDIASANQVVKFIIDEYAALGASEQKAHFALFLARSLQGHILQMQKNGGQAKYALEEALKNHAHLNVSDKQRDAVAEWARQEIGRLR